MDKLKRVVILFSLMFVILIVSTSCATSELTWSKNISRYVSEDGWVYTCEYFYYNDGRVDRSVPPVRFNAVNLRHLNNNLIQILGHGVSAETDLDMKKIASFLGYGESVEECLTIEELKQKNRSELELEVIDEEMFFKMFDDAITGTPHPVGKYLNHPSYALLNEPTFTDEYQFQIGYRLGMGCVDVIMIDVLYKDSTSTEGYIQLSDLIDEGEASADQVALFEQITKIEEGIVIENDFCYGVSELTDVEIASVKLARLYTFLSDIENRNSSKYDASAWHD